MTMTNAEIVADYRQAKNKRSQIGILADLNSTDAGTIKDILREAGEPLPRSPLDGEKLLELYNQGLLDKEIAKAMDCTLKSVVNWRKRRGLPANTPPAEEPPPEETEDAHPSGLSEICRRIEAILTALPANSSESTRSAACDLACCLLWDAMVRHGTGPTSNGSVRADPS